MIFGISIVGAEVKKNHDGFTDGLKISSDVHPKWGADRVYFSKLITGELAEYQLLINERLGMDMSLKDQSVEIKIDNSPVQELMQYKYKINKTNDNKYMFNSVLTMKIPIETITEIINARRVALRFERNNGLPIVYVLPDEVLAEWKQVIATEK